MKRTPEVYDFEAIGTHWWIETLDSDLTEEIKTAIDTYVRRFTRAYSRFDDESLISRLNIQGYLDNPPGELVEMLDYAKEMFEVTNGAFNISVSGTLHRFGYGPRARANTPKQNLWDTLSYDKNRMTLPPDTTIDIDGFGKGWMIDDIAELLEAHGVMRYIVNGGGDMRISSTDPIEVALEHPYDDTKSIGKTYITHGALAVSSIVKRSWKDGDEQRHHIIDPRTDAPANGEVVSTFVKAPTALLADTLATVLIVAPELEESLVRDFGIESIVLHESQLKT